MDIHLSLAELRSVASFDALHKPTYAGCNPVVTFTHDVEGRSTAVVRDRYRAVRLFIERPAAHGTFTVPLSAVRALARVDEAVSYEAPLRHCEEDGTVAFGDVHHKIAGERGPSPERLNELFGGEPANVDGVAYRVNVELSAVLQRLSAPIDFLTKSRSPLWSVSLLHAGTHMRLLHRRGPVELVLQAAGTRSPEPTNS